MKPLPFREVKRRLEAAGFVEVGQTGSHIKFAKLTSTGTRTATVPKHKEVAAARFGAFCARQESTLTISKNYSP